MKTPHMLLASGNCQKLRANLSHLLDATALKVLDDEIAANVRGLLDLAQNHYTFASRLGAGDWRQRISRAYYAIYNAGRAVRLFHDGSYSTESSDHKKIGDLPDIFPNRHMYANKLALLRDDRNLCDYDHTVIEAELVTSPRDALKLAEAFLQDATTYLRSAGFNI